MQMSTMKIIAEFCGKCFNSCRRVSFDLQDISDIPNDLRNSPSVMRYLNRCHDRFFTLNDRTELRERSFEVCRFWGGRMGMFLFLDATFSRLATRPGVLAGAQEPGPFPETALPGIREWLAETVHFARRPVYGWFLACGVIKHGIRVQWTKGAKFSVVTSVLGENDSWPFVGWVLIDSDNSAVYANSILKSYKLSKRCLWADAEAGSPKWDRFYFFCIILALVLAMGHGKVAVDNFYWNMTPKVYQTLPAFWNFMHREFERGMPSIGGCRGCGSKSTRRCDHCRQTSYCLTCFAAIAAKEFGRSRDRALVSWGGNYVECVPCQLRRPHNSQLMHLPDIPFSLITKWLSGEDKVRLSQVHPVLRKRDVSPDAKFVREVRKLIVERGRSGTEPDRICAQNDRWDSTITP